MRIATSQWTVTQVSPMERDEPQPAFLLKLKRVGDLYRAIRASANGNEPLKKHRLGILRRARKRLARIGVDVIERGGAAAEFKIKRRQHQTRDTDSDRAKTIVSFLKRENL